MIDEELINMIQNEEEWYCGTCGSYYWLEYGLQEYKCPKCGRILKR